MIWCFVVGVEGTGHHAISAIAEQPCVESASGPGTLDDLLARRSMGEPVSWEEIRAKEKAVEASGKTHFLYTSSFPFNQPRNALRRPNIRDLVLHSGIADLRPIVILRDPARCVLSAIRRGFTPSVREQAEIVSENLSYLQDAVPLFTRYRWLHYQDFSEEAVRRLSEYWSLPLAWDKWIVSPLNPLLSKQLVLPSDNRL